MLKEVYFTIKFEKERSNVPHILGFGHPKSLWSCPLLMARGIVREIAFKRMYRKHIEIWHIIVI